MADLQDILEVKELRDADEVNKLRSSGLWKVLSAGVGTNADGVLDRLYILGRVREEPEASEVWI